MSAQWHCHSIGGPNDFVFFFSLLLEKNWKFYTKPFGSRKLRLHFDDSCQLG